MKRRSGIVLHDVDLLLADTIAAKVFFEVHCRLQRHAEIARLVVGMKELFRRIYFVHIFPAAPVEGLEKCGKADVAKDGLPGKGILQVAHGALGGARRIMFVGQQHGLGDGHSQLGTQGRN